MENNLTLTPDDFECNCGLCVMGFTMGKSEIVKDFAINNNIPYTDISEWPSLTFEDNGNTLEK